MVSVTHKTRYNLDIVTKAVAICWLPVKLSRQYSED